MTLVLQTPDTMKYLERFAHKEFNLIPYNSESVDPTFDIEDPFPEDRK